MVETSGRDVEPEPQGTKKENKEWLPISQHISPPSPRRGLTPVLSICGSTITEARHIESREHSPSHASLLPPSHTTDEQGGHHLSDETIPCHRTFAPAAPASWSSTVYALCSHPGSAASPQRGLPGLSSPSLSPSPIPVLFFQLALIPMFQTMHLFILFLFLT